MFSKLDIKDSFWRMVCKEGEEWNFACVLTNHKGEPVEIVVPSVLQMGWVLSPPFFCAASETARNVASLYAAEPIGALPQHPLEDKTMFLAEDVAFGLPDTSKMDGTQRAGFRYLLEVRVDNFIQMAQTSNRNTLCHLSRALLHGVHSVFPSPEVTGHSDQDPVSLKKLMEGEGLWDVQKEILGWMFDGATRCIKPTKGRQDKIMKELKAVLRIQSGVPFNQFRGNRGACRKVSLRPSQ